jgi:hypothetical protein
VSAGVWPTSTALQAQYESLRAAALGEDAPPQARSGLNVLLLQGMWSWARAVAQRPLTEASAPYAPQPSRDVGADRPAIIRLLASMAMTITDLRTA